MLSAVIIADWQRGSKNNIDKIQNKRCVNSPWCW